MPQGRRNAVGIWEGMTTTTGPLFLTQNGNPLKRRNVQRALTAIGSFSAFSRSRAIGLFTAQPRVAAMAYCANEITPSMADLTWSHQPSGSGVFTSFEFSAIVPPAAAQGQHNTLKGKVLRAINRSAKNAGPAHTGTLVLTECCPRMPAGLPSATCFGRTSGHSNRCRSPRSAARRSPDQHTRTGPPEGKESERRQQGRRDVALDDVTSNRQVNERV